jgi:hypothetical protein
MASKVNTMASRLRGAKEAEAPSMPTRPKSVTIREAKNGGFIVKRSGGNTSEYDADDEVYKGLAAVKKCLAEHFGVAGEETEEKDSKEKSKET